jgi:hypothetical protein
MSITACCEASGRRAERIAARRIIVFKPPPQPLNATGIKHFTGTHFQERKEGGWTKDEEGVKPIREEVVRGGHDARRYESS